MHTSTAPAIEVIAICPATLRRRRASRHGAVACSEPRVSRQHQRNGKHVEAETRRADRRSLPRWVGRHRANLTRLSLVGGLWISSVKQKSWIEVNEEGTEAAAELGLPIDEQGHILFPDVQIEYTDADGRSGPVNIEVAEHLPGLCVRPSKSLRCSAYDLTATPLNQLKYISTNNERSLIEVVV